ncbi:MAG: hypothetical protein AAGC79_04335 [Pseudomonadota bacterium]
MRALLPLAVSILAGCSGVQFSGQSADGSVAFSGSESGGFCLKGCTLEMTIEPSIRCQGTSTPQQTGSEYYLLFDCNDLKQRMLHLTDFQWDSDLAGHLGDPPEPHSLLKPLFASTKSIEDRQRAISRATPVTVRFE